MPEEYEKPLRDLSQMETKTNLNTLRELVEGFEKQHYGSDPTECAKDYESLIKNSSYFDIHKAHALYYWQNIQALQQGMRTPKNEEERIQLKEYQNVLENRFRNHLFFLLMASNIAEQSQALQEHIQRAKEWGILSDEEIGNIFQNIPEKDFFEKVALLFFETDEMTSPQQSLLELESAQQAYRGRVGECAPQKRQGKQMDSWNEIAENMGTSLEKALVGLRWAETELMKQSRNRLMEQRANMPLETFQERMLTLANVQQKFLQNQFVSHFQIMETLYQFENKNYNAEDVPDIEELLGEKGALPPKFDEAYYQRHFPGMQQEQSKILQWGKKLLGFSEEKNKSPFETMLHEQADSAAQEIQKKAGNISEALHHLESGLNPSIITKVLSLIEPYLHKTEDTVRGGSQKLLKQQLDEIPLLNFFSPSLSEFIIQHPKRAGELLKEIYQSFDYKTFHTFQNTAKRIENGEIEQLLQQGKRKEAEDLLNGFFSSGEQFTNDYGNFIQKLSINLNDKEASARAWDWFQNSFLTMVAGGFLTLAGVYWAGKKAIRLAGKGALSLGARALSPQGIAFLFLALFPRSAGEGSELPPSALSSKPK